MRRVETFVLAAVAGLLGGCTVGPTYHKPETKAPAAFSEAPRNDEGNANLTPLNGGDTAVLARWWTVFHDPELNSLVERALRNNRDLKVAVSRVREARAERQVVAGGILPDIDATAGYNRSRGSKNVQIPFSALAGGGSKPSGAGSPRKVHGSDPGPFGLSPRRRGGGNASAGASAPAGHGSQAAESLRAAPTPPSGREAFPGSRRISTRRVSTRYGKSTSSAESAGRSRQPTPRRPRSRRGSTGCASPSSRRSPPPTCSFVRGSRGRRSRAGTWSRRENPGGSPRTRWTPASATRSRRRRSWRSCGSRRRPFRRSSRRTGCPSTCSPSCSGRSPRPSRRNSARPQALPADAGRGAGRRTLGPASFSRRPDIRKAERLLAVTSAEIGEATAQLYPQFSLTGAFGIDSSDLKHLPEWSSHYYSIAPGVSWPILDWAKLHAAIRVADAEQEQALLAYQSAVSQALKDVEDALVQYSQEHRRHDGLVAAVDQARIARKVTEQVYSQGLADQIGHPPGGEGRLSGGGQPRPERGEPARAAGGAVQGPWRRVGGSWMKRPDPAGLPVSRNFIPKGNRDAYPATNPDPMTQLATPARILS